MVPDDPHIHTGPPYGSMGSWHDFSIPAVHHKVTLTLTETIIKSELSPSASSISRIWTTGILALPTMDPPPIAAPMTPIPETGEGDPLLEIANAMLPVGASDQACKECRRRKARCNRALPTCDLCIKYRRHCLYEKHSRTPLTRKYLTEVETRLERAEALVRQMSVLVPPHLRSWEKQTPEATSLVTSQQIDFATRPDIPEPHVETSGEDNQAQHSSLTRQSSDGNSDESQVADGDQKILEGPPIDDFEWSERDPNQPHGLSPDGADGGDEDSPISDGLASLSVNERETGYLGVASGAALLRILEPNSRRKPSISRSQRPSPGNSYPMTPQPNPNRHVSESMIDAYFRHYHVSYPIIHEPTFRAQYSEIIPRPNGPCWTVLAYVVAAIGVWTSAQSSTDTLDLALFSQARSILSFNFLEVGNLTLVQALTLASNYVQKRDKPNSGYNYLGLAVRMAMGLGLHKEFQGWNISPLKMEIRRRVWWAICVFDVGATITFSRPDVWPYKGVEVAFPLNVNDKDLTAASKTYPTESNYITPYTAVTTQARFHVDTHECYDKVISKPFPSASELLKMEASVIGPWLASVPAYFAEPAEVPPHYALCQAVLGWRLRNLRIILYRPFVIRRALRRKADQDPSSETAYDRCLADAQATIKSISEFWSKREHNRLSAWYSLYFLFQAVLIPCICLRNEPSAPSSASWREQITTTLQTITAMSSLNASCVRCYTIISELCGRYLDTNILQPEFVDQTPIVGQQSMDPGLGMDPSWMGDQPVGESPQTQINSVFRMMWPNVPPLEAADVVMGDDAGWMEFLRAGSADGWVGPGS